MYAECDERNPNAQPYTSVVLETQSQNHNWKRKAALKCNEQEYLQI